MIQQTKKLFKNDFIAITLLGLIQGLLTALAMEPYGLPTGWFLTWPLFYLAWRFRTSVPKLLLSGLACALFFGIFLAYWVIGLFGTFAGLGTAASAALFVPFAILFNLNLTLFLVPFGLALRAGRTFRPRWLFAGAIALLADYCAPKFFPYCWGNFIAGRSLIVQITDVTGIYGLTLVLFMVSYFFYRITFRGVELWRGLITGADCMKTLGRPAALANFLAAPLILVLCLSYGAARLRQIDRLQKSLPSVRTAIINPNAPPEDRAYVSNAMIGEIMNVTIPGLVEKAAAAGPLDLVVLPESAVPFMCAEDTPLSRIKKSYNPDAELMAQLIAWNYNADVFMNETVYRAGPGADNMVETKIYNSSVLYTRAGRRGGSYQKRRLLAFGEYLPGEGLLKKAGLYKAVRNIMGSSRFCPGPASNLIGYTAPDRKAPAPERLSRDDVKKIGPRAFEAMFPAGRTAAPAGRFLPLICFESILPDHVRSFFGGPGGEPDFIVNITQDGWYGDTDETYQHFELARVRAVETRRALVRAVNDGAAGFVDLAGRHVTPLAGPVMTAPGMKGFQVWDVPVNRGMTTVYVKWGDWWIVVFLVGIGIVVAMRLIFSYTSHTPVRATSLQC